MPFLLLKTTLIRTLFVIQFGCRLWNSKFHGDRCGTLDSGKPTDPSQYTMYYNAQDLNAVVDAVVNKSPGEKVGQTITPVAALLDQVANRDSDGFVYTLAEDCILAAARYGKRITHAESGHLIFWEEPADLLRICSVC
ncbi:7260_t:CDS:2 [Ambispora gerdemannii]|uniref:7260_t:CDS:1 n=1 Tax=Ambispora gerdemannii TaxID=144530 RepID=A0A9N9GIG5_9GLOM|nr:7260_t:CDS:2 [Ambispora gerdemannii]